MRCIFWRYQGSSFQLGGRKMKSKATQVREYLLDMGVCDSCADKVLDMNAMTLHNLSNSLAKYELIRRRHKGIDMRPFTGKAVGAEVEHYYTCGG